ncbi:hypothetical protein R1sor_024675 [Riccia sorocarpa]|uniref:DDE Tnp4 domain-containing protein n=1 Tax=Riccia sorocarpa TaxID=122646 RepID=A0ABD3GTM0_9MARC
MVNYTNRVMIALESCMGHEIAWLDRQGRAAIAEHFAALGFPGYVGLVDGTLVKLSQRPRDDGETYFDRKSNYSLNAQDRLLLLNATVAIERLKNFRRFVVCRNAWQLARPDGPKAVRIVEASGLGPFVRPWTVFAWR